MAKDSVEQEDPQQVVVSMKTDNPPRRTLITGGAGFIGSHLADRLLGDGHSVTCVDDLSLGRKENLEHLDGNPSFRFVKMDLLDRAALDGLFRGGQFDCVYHMAANSDIQAGATNRTVDLDRTFLTTFGVLEAMKAHDVREIVFASSSAVYGELECTLLEDSGPLFPISFYGAAKLASEAYISAFVANFGFKAWIFRFPNVVGGRSTHGAMFDFMSRLEQNPGQLTILGDGTQDKPYLYVEDLVEGIVFGHVHSNEAVNCFNLGVDSSTTVTRIAEIVVEEMGLKHVRFLYTGGDRGWVGDVPRFRYDLSRIEALGWKAGRTSDEAVRLAVLTELDGRREARRK